MRSITGILVLCFSLFIFPFVGSAQVFVRVLDENNLQPIFNATILEEKTQKGMLTDKTGQIDFSQFKKGYKYIFSHSSYQTISLSYQEIINLGYKVEMSERIINIDEVVVSASKWEQDKTEVPNVILSISPKEVAFRNPQTAADMLESTGQVFVQKSQLGGGSPKIRGFSANSVLIMLDGVRMNNAIFRSGNLQNVILIDPNMVSGSEVIFGPGSVIYGSDALGGVMDFHTFKPKFAFEDKIEVSGAAMTRYATANNEKTGSFRVNIAGKKFSSLTGITYSDFGDLRAGRNRPDDFPDFGKRLEYIERVNGSDIIVENDQVNVQKFSGYNQINLLQKLSYRINSASNLTYSFYYTTSSDIPRYDRLILRDEDTGLLENAEWYYGAQKFSMHNLAYSNFSATKFYDGAKAILAYQTIEESRHDRPYQNDLLRSRTENVDVFSLNLDFDKKINNQSELFYGAEFVRNNVTSAGFSENIVTRAVTATATRYPDGGSDYTSIAFYSRYKRKLSDRLIATAGARYSHISINAVFDDKTFYDFPFDELSLDNGSVSGSLGLVYALPNDLKVSTMLSTGFRSPNIDDVGKVFDSEPGNVVVPNDDLSPEFTYTGELGITKNFNNKVQFEAVTYYTLLRDAIVRRDFTFNGSRTIVYDGVDSNVQALVNVGKAYVFGFSFGLKADLNKNFSLSSSFNYNEGEDKTENVPLRHTTPNFGQTSLTYKAKKLKTEFFVKYNGARKIEDFPPSELNKPHLYTSDGSLAWTTVNLRGSYQFNKVLSTTVALENILDLHYRPYSSGISAPGRNLVISLRGTF